MSKNQCSLRAEIAEPYPEWRNGESSLDGLKEELAALHAERLTSAKEEIDERASASDRAVEQVKDSQF
jgi:hypothetical protein